MGRGSTEEAVPAGRGEARQAVEGNYTVIPDEESQPRRRLKRELKPGGKARVLHYPSGPFAEGELVALYLNAAPMRI
uniref:Uncharacterized protein n=1 Tax=Sphaerodactylus townsendi TaxID=933632 RepID=A0ACB8FA58_9SAUR